MNNLDRAKSSKRMALVQTLSSLSPQICDAIIRGTSTGFPKPNRFEESEANLKKRVEEWIGVLIGFFEGKSGYRELTSGQISFEFERPELHVDENLAALQQATQVIISEIVQVIAQNEPAIQDSVKEGLEDVFAGLCTPCDVHIETLLVGDCLMSEIAGIATDISRRTGLGFSSFPINARSAGQLKAAIKDLGDRPYKAVFFSPFSHARSADLENLVSLRKLFETRDSIEIIADRIIAQTSPLVNVLAQNYNCPIYIHTAGLVPRGDTKFKSKLRERALRRRCTIAQKRINSWLTEHVAMLNQNLHSRIQLIDESEVASSMPLGQAGLLVHNSDFTHATHLSFALAQKYVNILSMLGRIYGRKLLICDLDNTLWDGVIGEGKVTHFQSRQLALARLKKNSGVVLSIASKNDPKNVSFKGGYLSDADFVVPQINWGPKTQSIEKICTALNLQKRHTVFIDDRQDELAHVKAQYPDVRGLDATRQDVWDQISLWADLVEGSSEVDRTSMYQAKASRDAFVETLSEPSLANAEDDFLKELEFEVDIRRVVGTDIRRAAELINRTNQWNLCGSRTSIYELEELLEGNGALVLIASAQDKFGDMGDVCVAVVEDLKTSPTISSFVLSCRVFGYNIETKMIDFIKDMVSIESPSNTLVGLYVPTNQNSLAKDMYSKNGFTSLDGNSFVLEVLPD